MKRGDAASFWGGVPKVKIGVRIMDYGLRVR